jgi:hypothetical protein
MKINSQCRFQAKAEVDNAGISIYTDLNLNAKGCSVGTYSCKNKGNNIIACIFDSRGSIPSPTEDYYLQEGIMSLDELELGYF